MPLPIKILIAAIVWFGVTALMQITVSHAVQNYETQLAADYDLPAVVSEIDGETLPIEDVTLETYNARRSLMTYLWVFWVLATFVPIVSMITVMIVTSQRSDNERIA